MALGIEGEIAAVVAALAEHARVNGLLKSYADNKSHKRLTGAEKDVAESLQALVRGKISALEQSFLALDKKIQMNKAELDDDDRKLLDKVATLKEIEGDYREKTQEYILGIERRMPVAFSPAEMQRRRNELLNLFKAVDTKQKIVVAGQGYVLSDRGVLGQTGRTLAGKEVIEHALYFIPRHEGANGPELDRELLHLLENNAWAREVLKNNPELEDKFNKLLLLERLQGIDIKAGNDELDELNITDHAAQKILHHDIDLSSTYQAKNTNLIQLYAELIRDTNVFLQNNPAKLKLFSDQLKGKLHSQIQATEGTAKKILIMERWVWVAEQCRAMGDYAGALAIVAVLNEPQWADIRGHISSKARGCLSNYLDINKMIKDDVTTHLAVVALPADWQSRKDLEAKRAEIERYQDAVTVPEMEVQKKQDQLFAMMAAAPAKVAVRATVTDIIRNDYDHAPRLDHFSNVKVDAVVNSLRMAIALYRQHLNDKKNEQILQVDKKTIEDKLAFLNNHLSANLQKSALASAVKQMEVEFDQLRAKSAQQSAVVASSAKQPSVEKSLRNKEKFAAEIEQIVENLAKQPDAVAQVVSSGTAISASAEIDRMAAIIMLDNAALTDILIKGGNKFNEFFARNDLVKVQNAINAACITHEGLLKQELAKFGINDLSDEQIQQITAENIKMQAAKDQRFKNNAQKINNPALRDLLLANSNLYRDTLFVRDSDAKINAFNAAEFSSVEQLKQGIKALGINDLAQAELAKVFKLDQLQKNSGMFNELVDRLDNMALRELIKANREDYMLVFSDPEIENKIQRFNQMRSLNENALRNELQALGIEPNTLNAKDIQAILENNRALEGKKVFTERFEAFQIEIGNLWNKNGQNQTITLEKLEQTDILLDNLLLLKKNIQDNVPMNLHGNLLNEIDRYHQQTLSQNQQHLVEHLAEQFENPVLRQYLKENKAKLDDLINKPRDALRRISAFNAYCGTNEDSLSNALNQMGIKAIPEDKHKAILNCNKAIQVIRRHPPGMLQDKLLESAKRGEIVTPEAIHEVISLLSAVDNANKKAATLDYLREKHITGFNEADLDLLLVANQAAAQARAPIVDMASFNARFEKIKLDFNAIENHVPAFDHHEKHRILLAIKAELDQLLQELIHSPLANHVDVQRLREDVKQYQKDMEEQISHGARLTQNQVLRIEAGSQQLSVSHQESHASRSQASESSDSNGRYYINDKDYYDKQSNQFSYDGPASADVEKMLTHAYQTYGLPDSQAKVTLSGSEELVKQAYIYYKARGVEVVLKQHTALASAPQVQAEVERKRTEFARKVPTEIGVHESQRQSSRIPHIPSASA